MIHNSFDSNPDQRAMCDSTIEQNQSWISLRSLKDIIRLSAEKQDHTNIDDHLLDSSLL